MITAHVQGHLTEWAKTGNTYICDIKIVNGNIMHMVRELVVACPHNKDDIKQSKEHWWREHKSTCSSHIILWHINENVCSVDEFAMELSLP